MHIHTGRVLWQEEILNQVVEQMGVASLLVAIGLPWASRAPILSCGKKQIAHKSMHT